LGEDDPSTLDAQKLFGENLMIMRRYKASVDLFESVLPRFEKVFGATSDELMCAEYYLGDGYLNIGRLQEALNMLERTLNRHVEIVGDKDRRTFAVQCSFMKACFRLGRSAECVSMLESAVALIAKVPHNGSVMSSQVGFAHMYFELGRYVDVTKLLESVAGGKLKTLVSYDVDVLLGQVLLAESYYLTKRFYEASAILFEGGLLARTKHALGNNNSMAVRAIRVSKQLRASLNYELHGMVFPDSIPS
jgi:tetratricopeptide (TPR) repeat protein